MLDCLVLLIPTVFIVFGWMWKHGHYPKRRNAFCGYRTALSMQPDASWKFSQEMFGRVSWWCGWLLLATSLLAAFVLRHCGICIRDVMAYFVVGQVGFGVLSVYVIVESTLRRRFGAGVKAQSKVFDKEQHQRKFGIGVALFLSVLLLPVIFIVIGWMGMNGMFPESINGTYGYRTALSMQSQEAWRFAQTYFGLMAWKVGWISMVVSCIFAVVLFCKINRKRCLHTLVLFVLFMQLMSMITFSVLPVENALRVRFGEAKGTMNTTN